MTLLINTCKDLANLACLRTFQRHNYVGTISRYCSILLWIVNSMVGVYECASPPHAAPPPHVTRGREAGWEVGEGDEGKVKANCRHREDIGY